MKHLNTLATTLLALALLSGCSATPEDRQKQAQLYDQLYKESPKKLMIVVHGDDAVPVELIEAFTKKVPAIVADHGFDIVDPQQRQLTEVPALTDVDAVLYVDIQRWNKDSSAVIVAATELDLEFRLVSARSEQDLWRHQEKYSRTHLYLGADFLSELIHRAFYEASSAYENQASSITKNAFADFPEELAANR